MTRKAGRPIAPLQRRLLRLLHQEGLLTAQELADRVGETPRRVRHALWYWQQHSCVELVYSLTHEGQEKLK